MNHTVGPPDQGLTSFKDGLMDLQKTACEKGKNQQRMGMGFRSESEGVMIGFNKAESHN